MYLEALERAVNKSRLHAIRDEIQNTNGRPDEAIKAVLGFKPLRLTVNGLVAASSIELKTVSWLWAGWLPAGELSVLDGDPGTGKSQISVDLAARASRGHLMPPYPRKQGQGRDRHDPANVLYVSAEDAAETVLRPRLQAAGADVERVRLLSQETEWPVLPEGLPMLSRWMDQYKPRLVVIDPFFAFLGFKVESHSDHRLRTVLSPLCRPAARRC